MVCWVSVGTACSSYCADYGLPVVAVERIVSDQNWDGVCSSRFKTNSISWGWRDGVTGALSVSGGTHIMFMAHTALCWCSDVPKHSWPQNVFVWTSHIAWTNWFLETLTSGYLHIEVVGRLIFTVAAVKIVGAEAEADDTISNNFKYHPNTACCVTPPVPSPDVHGYFCFRAGTTFWAQTGSSSRSCVPHMLQPEPRMGIWEVKMLLSETFILYVESFSFTLMYLLSHQLPVMEISHIHIQWKKCEQKQTHSCCRSHESNSFNCAFHFHE